MPENEKQIPPLSPFPATQVQVAANGMVIETFLAPGFSLRQVLNEQQCNAMFAEWVKTRKQVQAQQQLITDVMNKKLN